MNRIKILLVIFAFAVAMTMIAPLIVNPILKKKILATLNQKYPDYDITIEKVRWMLIPSRLTLKKITVRHTAPPWNKTSLKGDIQSIQFNGIRNIKALFEQEYEIHDIVVTNSHIEGKIPFSRKEKIPVTSTIKVRIDHIRFHQINLALKDTSSAQTLIIEEGALQIKDLDIKEKDPVDIFHRLDFRAKSVGSNSPDSMYTYRVHGVVYSDSIRMLSIDSLLMVPNYKRYDFTGRYPYETDRFDMTMKDIKLLDFHAGNFYKSGQLVSSCLSIGHVDLEAFRDKRKKDSKENKPAFQEYIYRYPGFLRIDSMLFDHGDITYIEHADGAEEPGWVHLKDLKAKAYSITNDTIYKTKDTSLTIIAEALLMGKSKMAVSLKARLFDPMNTFSMKGSLAAMDIKELNPILERNAYINANTTRVNQLKFNFIANDTKATGELIMLYDALDLAVINKRTEETDGLKEQIISLIANKATWDANPLPKEQIRVGIIDYERDSTKFVINYCLKSIVSGVKSTIIKLPKKKKSFFLRLFTSKQTQSKDTFRY